MNYLYLYTDMEGKDPISGNIKRLAARLRRPQGASASLIYYPSHQQLDYILQKLGTLLVPDTTLVVHNQQYTLDFLLAAAVKTNQPRLYHRLRRCPITAVEDLVTKTYQNDQDPHPITITNLLRNLTSNDPVTSNYPGTHILSLELLHRTLLPKPIPGYN